MVYGDSLEGLRLLVRYGLVIPSAESGFLIKAARLGSTQILNYLLEEHDLHEYALSNLVYALVVRERAEWVEWMVERLPMPALERGLGLLKESGVDSPIADQFELLLGLKQEGLSLATVAGSIQVSKAKSRL